MKIESNILAISKCMFQERKNWEFVTDEQKELFFFIFNRYFSKKYPHLSQLLNDKMIDKVTGMNLWFHFMDGKPYPKWFWSKSERNNSKNDFTDKDKEVLLKSFGIKDQELDFLIQNHFEEVKEELKYIKEMQK